MDVANRRITRSIGSGVLTELRIHGVGGAGPESVLDVPYSDFVAGDPTAGFFARPTELPLGGPPRRVEAYSWGGLTSRSRLRALWILLLPFALVNLGGWMLAQARPGLLTPRAVNQWMAAAAVRVLGLVVTATAVLYAAVAAIDLYGYQCGVELCTGDRLLLWPVANTWSSVSLGRQLAVASLIPIGVIALIAYLTKRSQDWVHPDVAEDPAHLDPAPHVDLTDRGFWTAKHVAHRLGLAHTAVAFATVGYILSATVAELPDVGFGDGYKVTFAALMIGGATLVVLIGRLGKIWFWSLLGLSGSALGGLVWVTMLLDGDARQLGQAPGTRSLASPLGAVTVAVLVVIALVQLVAVARGESIRNRVYNWFAPLAVLFGGLSLVLVVGSGALIQVANYLGNGVSHATWVAGADPSAGWPVVYSDTAAAVAVNTLIVLAIVVVTALGVFVYRWVRRDRPTAVVAEYAGADTGNRLVMRIAQRVSTARVLAGMTDHAGTVVVTAIIGLVAAISVAAFIEPIGGSRFLASLQEPAANLLALLVIGAVILIGRTTRSEGLRRGIGIVWDILTFWPRWYHPWAPPAYGERAVPQLAHRIRTLTADGCVVVSAHSQGSLVAVAAIAKLGAEHGSVPRVGLITHGSPLRRLYGRYLTRYVNGALLQRVTELLAAGGGWVNLHRRTDFIGGTMMDEALPGFEDRSLLDPPTLALELGGPIPKPAKHFGYFHDPIHDELIAAMATALGCEGAP